MASRGNRDVHRSHTNFLCGPASHDGAVSFQSLRIALAQIGVIACMTDYVLPPLVTLPLVDSVVRAEGRDMLTIRKANRDDVFDAWEIRKASVHAACAGFYPEAAPSGWVDGTPTDKWASVVERDFYVAADKGLIVGTGMLQWQTDKSTQSSSGLLTWEEALAAGCCNFSKRWPMIMALSNCTSMQR